MTKKDFLNALIDPTHAEVKVKLRTLRRELRVIKWKLQYRYNKKTSTFYMKLSPTAASAMNNEYNRGQAFRLLEPLHRVKNTEMDASRERHGCIWADIYLI